LTNSTLGAGAQRGSAAAEPEPLVDLGGVVGAADRICRKGRHTATSVIHSGDCAVVPLPQIAVADNERARSLAVDRPETQHDLPPSLRLEPD
jgi:hypothetical protein